jgi:DNA mismatch repair protein MutL
MDQHAAHERVLYEELMEKFNSSGVISQRVIEPIAVRLMPGESQIIAENLKFLADMGFELEDMYDNNIAIRSVPYIFGQPADGAFFAEILDKLADNSSFSAASLRVEAVSRLACRAAVKANDRLNAAEARAIINRALKLENPFTCPHGRPIMVELTRKETEKMFLRM